jgi:hypothetical protein
MTSMAAVGFEPVIPASERTHSYALDRAAAEISVSSRDVITKPKFYFHRYYIDVFCDSYQK